MSPIVRSYRLSILNPSARTNFNKEGVAMVGAASSHGPEVPARPGGLIRHNGLQSGHTFLGGRGNPLGTRWCNITAKLFNGAQAVAPDSVDCWDLL